MSNLEHGNLSEDSTSVTIEKVTQPYLEGECAFSINGLSCMEISLLSDALSMYAQHTKASADRLARIREKDSTYSLSLLKKLQAQSATVSSLSGAIKAQVDLYPETNANELGLVFI